MFIRCDGCICMMEAKIMEGTTSLGGIKVQNICEGSLFVIFNLLGCSVLVILSTNQSNIMFEVFT